MATHSLSDMYEWDVMIYQTFMNWVATHNLRVKGEDVMKLPFAKCEMSLTTCWS